VTADPKTVPSVSEEMSSPTLVHEPASNQPAARTPEKKSTIWLVRVRALLLVTLCATFGVLLVILPWTPKWTDNPLLLSWPELRAFVSNGFVRGVASGVGLLDLWLGFWEAVHYHEHPVSTR
jgi:hypothetical protein